MGPSSISPFAFISRITTLTSSVCVAIVGRAVGRAFTGDGATTGASVGATSGACVGSCVVVVTVGLVLMAGAGVVGVGEADTAVDVVGEVVGFCVGERVG